MCIRPCPSSHKCTLYRMHLYPLQKKQSQDPCCCISFEVRDAQATCRAISSACDSTIRGGSSPHMRRVDPLNLGCALGMDVWDISKLHLPACIPDVILNLCTVVGRSGNKTEVKATLSGVQGRIPAHSDQTLWSGLTHWIGFAVSMNCQNNWRIQWRKESVKLLWLNRGLVRSAWSVV